MRPAQLRALLKELRAGGVSEYSTTDRKGGTTTIKLAGPHMPVSATRTTAGAPAKATAPLVSSALRQQLEELGVDVDQAREVLASCGIGSGADGN